MKLLIWISNLLITIVFTSLLSNFKDDDGYIILQEIELSNTKIKGDFLFDTGAQLTVIDSSLLESFNYKDIGYITSTDFYGNQKKVKKINISSIKINETTFNNIDAFVMNLSAYQCYNFKGIIGFNLIKKANWHIDFKGKKIKSFPISKSIYVDKATKLPFKIKNESMQVNLKITSKIYKTIFDSGAKNEINLAQEDLDTTKIKDSLYSVELYTNTLNQKNGIKRTVLFTKMYNLMIGKNSFDKKVSFNGARTIGIDFFKNTDFLIIDFKKGEVLFNNTKKPQTEDIITKHGIYFKKLDSGEIIVSYLRKNSTLQKLGIKVGDKVLSVNDISCDDLNICDCNNLLNKEAKNGSIKIKFQDKGELFSF